MSFINTNIQKKIATFYCFKNSVENIFFRIPRSNEVDFIKTMLNEIEDLFLQYNFMVTKKNSLFELSSERNKQINVVISEIDSSLKNLKNFFEELKNSTKSNVNNEVKIALNNINFSIH